MSQYQFTTHEHTIVLGWDPPLATYFAQVWKGDPGSPENVRCDHPDLEPEPLLCIGVRPEEIATVEALGESLKPYAEIPTELIGSLRGDRDHGPAQGKMEHPTPEAEPDLEAEF